MPATTNILHESRTKLPEYAEACYIAENIEHYANLKGVEIPQTYNHLAITDPNTIDSTAILNGLRGHGAPGQNFFQDVPKSIAGDFQPWVKIYKVIPGSTKKDHDKDIIIPLKFNNLKNLDMMNSHKLGVAFRSFTFDYEGTRPVEVDSYLRCSMKLYFESPKALFKKYTHKNHKYSFADLIRRTVPTRGLSTDQQHLVYDGTSFRIRVDVGYTPPSVGRLTEAYREAGFDKPKQKAQGLRAALLSSKMQLYLNLLKHSIAPIYDAPDGGFELTVDYMGAIETSFRSKKADILFTPEDPNSRKIEMTLRKDDLDKQNAAFKGLTDEQKDKVQAFIGTKGSFEEVKKQIIKEYEQSNRLNELRLFVGANVVVTNPLEQEARKRLDSVTDESFAVSTPGGPDLELAAAKLATLQRFDIYDDQQKDRIIDYLGYRDYINSTRVGQTIKQGKKMSRMYSQIIDRLTDKQQLHYIRLPESDLYTWFGAKKAKVKAQEDADRLEEINKELEGYTGRTGPPTPDEIEHLSDLNTEKQVLEHEIAAATRRNIATGPPPDPETGTKDGSAAALSKASMENEAKKAAAEHLAKKQGEETDTMPNSRTPFTDMANAATLGERNIFFFYYGDLLDTVLEMLYELKDDMDLDWWSIKNKTGSIKFLLGEVEFIHPQKRVLVKENLAKIPITLKVWHEFWIENVIDQWRTEYLFDSFLNDTLSQLVVESLTGRCKDEGNVNVSILGYPSYLTIPNINNKVVFKPGKIGMERVYGLHADLAHYYSYGARPEKPEERGASNDANKIKTGELIFVQAASNSGKWFKDRTTDISRGVYHLDLGRENSTILNFQMNRSNQPHYLEAKLEAQGIDDVHAFGEPYNYDITMYGNSLLIPGKHLKVTFPHTWFSLKEQNSLGIGGYCMVLKTKNEVKAIEARLEWTTNLQCLWQSFGGGKPPVAGSGQGVRPPEVPPETREGGIGQADFNSPDVSIVPLGQQGTTQAAETMSADPGGALQTSGAQQLAAEQERKNSLKKAFTQNQRMLATGKATEDIYNADGSVTQEEYDITPEHRKDIEDEQKEIQEQLRKMER